MLKINSKLSKKGFTLVELMVAIAILAVASIGIFQAFTVGFQSMADAKYRTVATNIAQEKLEEVKNSVEVAYPYYSMKTQEVNNTIYTVTVTTNSQTDNLEQVYVTVSWHDRQGNEKNVQLETLVYDLQIDYDVEGPDVYQIHLSADSTQITCCVVGETSTITAELLNSAGYSVPSGTPVRFNVTNGSVNPEFTVTNTIGKATTQLTLNGKNTATVTASSGNISSDDDDPHGDGDALEISCVTKANKIILSASPYAITPSGSSLITATVTDACGDVLSEDSDQVYVTFITDNGSFDNSEPVITDSGIATVVLNNMEISDVATVVGTITVDQVVISDSTTVICTNYSISVTANPPSINPGGDNDTSTITATLIASGGSSVNLQDISFTTDKGSFENEEKTIIKTTGVDGKATAYLSSLIGGDIATITASYVTTIGTISATTTVQCAAYVIYIIANPNKVISGSSSTITATLKDYLGNPASNKRVDFYSTKGTLSDDSVYTDINGIAITNLTLGNIGEIANVSANYGLVNASVNVECMQFSLVLTAVPPSINPNESSEITAILTNYGYVPPQLENGAAITFKTDKGYFTTPGVDEKIVNTGVNGKAVVDLILDTIGTAIVTAKYIVDENTLAEDTVTVNCFDTYITLNNPSNIDVYGSSNNYVRFDLYLHGGPLTVDKVKIDWQTSWGNPSRYYYVWIEQPIGSSQTEIYDNYGWGSHQNKNSTETLDTEYTISANSSFRIRIRFISSIRNNHIIFTFNPDDPGADENYQVEFPTGW